MIPTKRLLAPLAIAVVAILGSVALAAAGCSGATGSSDFAPSGPTASSGLGSTEVTNAADSPSSTGQAATTRLLLYAGAASKPATEEVMTIFEQETGIRVEAIFGGSGAVLSQMELAREGDLYFPGSSDYMEKAKKKGDVIPETEAIVTYLVPAITVQKGNPKNIQTLKDLTRPGLKVAIANPETVCVGLYAVEIIEKNLSADEKAAFRANLLNYTESCEKTATAISLKQVDAVIGWSVFSDWDPENIETVPLPAEQIPRVGYIPIAVASFTKHREQAQRFIDFVTGSQGQAVFAKYGYYTTPEQAFAYIGETKPVGGEYVLPPDWVTK